VAQARPIKQHGEEASPMNRTPVNPWPWSLSFGYNQAGILEGVTRLAVAPLMFEREATAAE